MRRRSPSSLGRLLACTFTPQARDCALFDFWPWVPCPPNEEVVRRQYPELVVRRTDRVQAMLAVERVNVLPMTRAHQRRVVAALQQCRSPHGAMPPHHEELLHLVDQAPAAQADRGRDAPESSWSWVPAAMRLTLSTSGAAPWVLRQLRWLTVVRRCRHPLCWWIVLSDLPNCPFPPGHPIEQGSTRRAELRVHLPSP